MSAADENVTSETENTNDLSELPGRLRAKTISEINGTSESELASIPLKRKIPVEELTQPLITEGEEATATKRRRTVDEHEEPAAGSSTNAEQVNNHTNYDAQAAVPSDYIADKVTVKCEPVEPDQGEQSTPDGHEPDQADQSTTPDDDVQRPSSSGTSNPVDVKPAIKVEKADASSTSRESCKFGIRCYRRNPMHRIEEAHPGDHDYTRPSFPPPPKGTPDCPFGNLCYRRNPVHFQQYNHPLDTDFQQNYKNHRMRLRQRRQQNTSDATSGSDLDDYDLDDPFIDDGDDDDEYVPSADEEDTEEFGADYDDGDKAEE